jgi:hypothetical protein
VRGCKNTSGSIQLASYGVPLLSLPPWGEPSRCFPSTLLLGRNLCLVFFPLFTSTPSRVCLQRQGSVTLISTSNYLAPALRSSSISIAFVPDKGLGNFSTAVDLRWEPHPGKGHVLASVRHQHHVAPTKYRILLSSQLLPCIRTVEFSSRAAANSGIF